jgi:hypothetical protein
LKIQVHIKLFLCLLCWSISTKLIAQQSEISTNTLNIVQLSSIPWNHPSGIQYRQVPGANIGATSFQLINENQIAFLCNSNSEIVVVNITKGETVFSFPVNYSPRDFYFDKGKYYVLSEGKVSVYDQNGNEISYFTFPAEYSGTEKLIRYLDTTYLLLPSGNSLIVESGGKAVAPVELKGWPSFSGLRVFTQIISPNQYRVSLLSQYGKKFERTFSTANKVAGVFVVGATSNRIFLDVQTYISESPVRVERKLVYISIGTTGIGNILAELNIPDMYYVLSNTDFILTSKGVLYHKIAAPEGIFIFLITEQDGNLPATGYPEIILNRKYHFNDHLINVE